MQSASVLRVRESDIHKFFQEGDTIVKRILKRVCISMFLNFDRK